MKKTNKRGFTIVELVIVIAVIAILAAVLIPTFSGVINKANQAKDTQLVRNLNTSLALDVDVKHNTMQDALDAVAKQGYDLDKINASAMQAEILWDSHNDAFVYLDGEGNINYLPEIEKDRDATELELWQICNEMPATQKYSIYAGNGWSVTSVEGLTVGFDAGKNTNIASVNYVNSASGQSVVIRTNGANTTLTIDDASTGTIYHYGSAGALNIIQCHTASYHENGDIAFAEIAKGRIVLESGSEIKHIHVNANEEANGFDTVIIADNGAEVLPESITRDEVTVTTETLVVKVESNGSTENVYVYADGSNGAVATGSTEKTDTHNAAVSSALGQLVLDNGTESKALSENMKEEVKTAVIDELAEEEVLAENENGAKYVARIGNVGYNTFVDAYGEAKSGDTIVLLQNIVFGETIEGNFIQEEWTTSYDFDKKGITLDLNGKTMLSTSGSTLMGPLIGFYIKLGAELTIKDSVGTGMILAPNAEVVISCYGVINIYGGTIQSQYTSGLSDALRVNGRANIYGGTISSATNYYYPDFGYFGNNGLNNCGVTYIYGGTFSCQVKDEYYNGAIANSGSLYIMDNIITQGLYWTNDNSGVTQTIISVAEGKTLTVDGAYSLNPANSKPIVLNGNAIYTDEDGNIAIIYTELDE